MGNFFGKAVLTAFAVIAVLSVGCSVYGYGGVWGNIGNILEDEEVPKETEAATAETEPDVTEFDNNMLKIDEAPISPWDRTNKGDTVKPDDSNDKLTSENKLSQEKKKKLFNSGYNAAKEFLDKWNFNIYVENYRNN